MSDPLQRLRDRFADQNPHHVMDGPWGGWGPAFWIAEDEDGWDVYERELLPGARLDNRQYRWARMWDNAAKQWRLMTAAEVEKLSKRYPQIAPPVEVLPERT